MDLLALFDIDGLLVNVYSANRAAYLDATNKVWGVSVPLPDRHYPVRPSRNVKEGLLNSGVPLEEIEDKADYFDVTVFPSCFKKAVQLHRPEVLPGIKHILRILGQNSISMAVVTGNDVVVANLILELAGLDKYFITGAYGSDAEKRKDILQKSIERTQEETGKKYSPESVVVFDDSIEGIKVAKKLGYTTVAVATGISTYEDLLQTDPNYCLENLEYQNSQRLLKEVFEIDTNQ